eukprot:358897-Chlamydomonas_euryale.AAC.1
MHCCIDHASQPCMAAATMQAHHVWQSVHAYHTNTEHVLHQYCASQPPVPPPDPTRSASVAALPRSTCWATSLCTPHAAPAGRTLCAPFTQHLLGDLFVHPSRLCQWSSQPMGDGITPRVHRAVLWPAGARQPTGAQKPAGAQQLWHAGTPQLASLNGADVGGASSASLGNAPGDGGGGGVGSGSGASSESLVCPAGGDGAASAAARAASEGGGAAVGTAVHAAAVAAVAASGSTALARAAGPHAAAVGAAGGCPAAASCTVALPRCGAGSAVGGAMPSAAPLAVVVKCARSREQLRPLLAEANLLRKLKHPHIVKVGFVGRGGGEMRQG